MGSVQFQLVPCSSLYFFSRSIALSNVVNTNYSVLICCTCLFQGDSLFILASSVCKPLQCLTSTLTQGGEGGHLFRCTSLVPGACPGCTTRIQSQVCCVSPLGDWSLAVILLADVNHPGSQEDLVSNWEPAHSLVEVAISGAEISPCLLALAVACLPLCLWQGDGLVCSQLALSVQALFSGGRGKCLGYC